LERLTAKFMRKITQSKLRNNIVYNRAIAHSN